MLFFVQSGVDLQNHKNMVSIDPDTIHEFIVEDVNYLPPEPLLKLDFSLT
jgi:hypothetical protein